MAIQPLPLFAVIARRPQADAAIQLHRLCEEAQLTKQSSAFVPWLLNYLSPLGFAITILLVFTRRCNPPWQSSNQPASLDRHVTLFLAMTWCLSQQRQHIVRQCIGLRQHRNTSLLQNLCTSQCSSFSGEVGILNPAA